MDLFCYDVFCLRQYTASFFQEKWKLFVFELFSYKITHAKYLSVMSELKELCKVKRFFQALISVMTYDDVAYLLSM